MSALETDSHNTKAQISNIFSKLEHIETMLGQSNKTNWTVIFSTLALVGAMWAAAIHPLNADLDRHARDAESLATAVLKQNEQINTLRTSEAIQDASITDFKKTQEKFEGSGSPALDKRISVLETLMLPKKP